MIRDNPILFVSFFVSLQDTAADKASLGSGRSFRSSERSFRDDFDSTSLSSSHNTGNITISSGTGHHGGGAIGTNPSGGGGSGTSLASGSTKHPRINAFGQRIPKLGSAALQHRTLSIDSNTGSYNIPENVSLEQELEEQDQQEQQSLSSSLTQSPKVTVSPVATMATGSSSTSPSRTAAIDEPPKSRTHILRNLFFAQTGPGTAGSRDGAMGGSSPKS